MKHLKCFLWLMAVFFYVIPLNGQNNQSPFSFQFDRIPFKESLSEVRALVGARAIEEGSNTTLQPINQYKGMKDILQDGLYTIMGLEYYFHRDLVTKYQINYGNEIKSVELFFAQNGDDQESLFAVRKIMRDQSIAMGELFDAFRDRIVESTGVVPHQYDSKYYPAWDWQMEGRYWDGRVGIWDLEGHLVFLLANHYMTTTIEFVYIDKLAWEEYVAACRSLDKEAQKKKDEKKKAVTDEW